MADILKEVANINTSEEEKKKDTEIVLSELEKHFDIIAEDKKNDERQIRKLVEAFEENLKNNEYAFDYAGIKNDILDKWVSNLDVNTIKVYQLCKNLEIKKTWIGEPMKINGDTSDLIYDKLMSYDKKSLWLLWSDEKFEYDGVYNTLSLQTKFGEYSDVLADFKIIDNQENYKNFIDKTREKHFNDFLLTNKITDNESEFKKSMTEKYKNAQEDVCLMDMESDKKAVHIDYKNDEAYVDCSYDLEIQSDTKKEDVIAFIEKSRELYKQQVIEREKYNEFLSEVDKTAKGTFADAYNNIGLMLWDKEYAVFKKAKFSLHDITKEELWTLKIDEKGKLVMGEKNIPILPNYDFSSITVDKQFLLIMNISKILEEFVTYFPDNTTRRNFATLDEIKNTLHYEKKVIEMYLTLIKPENVAQCKKWTLNLNALNATYRGKAFGYLMGELKNKWETPESIVKNRTVDCAMFKFVETKRDSVKDDEQWYVKLYYVFIQQKLWNALKIETNKESTTWLLDENKINTTFSSDYQWLLCQKWAWGQTMNPAETDKKILELEKKNNWLKWMSPEQKSILLKTEMGKWLLKNALYTIESKKYESVNKEFTTYETGYNERIKKAYGEIKTAENILYNTNGSRYWGMNKNGDMVFDRKSVPDIYRQYIVFNKNAAPNPRWEIDEGKAGDRVRAVKKPFEEKRVQHMKNIHQYWLTQYIEWTPSGATQKVNMAYAINNKKTIQSPFADKYCQSKMDFSFSVAQDVVRDTTWEGIMDRWYEKWDAIEQDPLNGIGSTVVDVAWIVVWWIAAWIVSVVSTSPHIWALVFTAVDNIVKAWGYGVLEGINYLAWTGDMWDYDNIFEAMDYGALKWFGVVETETNVYQETSYKKDANGDLVIKDREVILAEKGLEIGSSLILFGPVGKIGKAVTKEVFNNLVVGSCVKSYGKDMTYKIFGKEISNFGAKTVANSAWFFAEVGTFTAFNAFYSPFSASIVTLAQTGDWNQAMMAGEAAWKESTSAVGLATNFIHNVWFIGLLKWSNLLAEPLSSKIMTNVEKSRYVSAKTKADVLWKELDVEMTKNKIKLLTPEKIMEAKNEGKVIVDKFNEWKEWWFFKETDTGYEFVPDTKPEVSKIMDLHNQVTKLNGEVALLMQSIKTKSENVKEIEDIKKFNEFVVKNNLEGKEVTPEIILDQRIEYCENKIKNSEWTEKVKYQEMLETLKSQKIELATLREWYLKTLDLIEMNENGTLSIKNQGAQKIETEWNIPEIPANNASEAIKIEEKNEVNIRDRIEKASNAEELLKLLEENATTVSVNELQKLIFKLQWLNAHAEAIKAYEMIKTKTEYTEKADVKAYFDAQYMTSKVEMLSAKVGEKELTEVEFKEQVEMLNKELETLHCTENGKLDLQAQIDKAQFEYYRNENNVKEAQVHLKNYQSKYATLSSKEPINSINSIPYARGVVDGKLMELQISDAINNKMIKECKAEAQKLLDKCDMQDWIRSNDPQVILGMIEANLLLRTSVDKIQPLLKKAALLEKWMVQQNIRSRIETIETLVDVWKELTNFANEVKNANAKTENKLSQESENAIKVSEMYDKIKEEAQKDPNKLIEELMNQNVVDIRDIGNTFAWPRIIYNEMATKGSNVPSIEVNKSDYAAAKPVLKEKWLLNEPIKGEKINLDKELESFNAEIDAYIRTNFNTEKLQELHSADHRALDNTGNESFSVLNARSDKAASLTNIAQMLKLNNMADCRVHAYLKQLMFDTWKQAKIEQLETIKTSTKDTWELSNINKNIAVLQNTHMIFMDAQISWEVSIKAKYQPDLGESNYMNKWVKDNVIEEHTFNLIQKPIVDAEGNIVGQQVMFADAFYQGNGGKLYDLSYANSKDISGDIIGKKPGEISFTIKDGLMVRDANGYLVKIDITIKPLEWSMKSRSEVWSEWLQNKILWTETNTAVETINKISAKNDTEVQALKENYDKVNTELKETKVRLDDAIETWQEVTDILSNMEKISSEIVASQSAVMSEWIRIQRTYGEKMTPAERKTMDEIFVKITENMVTEAEHAYVTKWEKNGISQADQKIELFKSYEKELNALEIQKFKEKIQSDVNTKIPEKIDILEKEIADLKAENTRLETDGNADQVDANNKIILKKEGEMERLKNTKKGIEKSIALIEKIENKNTTEITKLSKEIKELENKKNVSKDNGKIEEMQKEIDVLRGKMIDILKENELLSNSTVHQEQLLVLQDLRVSLDESIRELEMLYNKQKSGQNVDGEIQSKTWEIDILREQIRIETENLQYKAIAETYVGLRNLWKKAWFADKDLAIISEFYKNNVIDKLWASVVDCSQSFGKNVYLDATFNNVNKVTFKNVAWKESATGLTSQYIETVKAEVYKIEGNADAKSVSTTIEKTIADLSNPAERELATELRKGLENNVTDTRLSPAEKAVIFSNSMSHMCDYRQAFPEKSSNDVYLLLEANQNKIMHQHVVDKSNLTWSSHDVLHILKGNMIMAEGYMKNMSPLEKVILRQAIVDHDMWYTLSANKFMNEMLNSGDFTYYDATKDHPIWSANYIKENADRYTHFYGIDWYRIIYDMVLSHSKAITNDLPLTLPTDMAVPRENMLKSVMSTVDCAAATADYKSAALFSQPYFAGKLLECKLSLEANNLEQAKNNLKDITETVTKSTNADEVTKNAYLDALDSMWLKPDKNWDIPLIKSIDAGTMDIAGLQKKLQMPFEKYVSQYGVRVSHNAEWLPQVWMYEVWWKGVVEAEFELAGEMFWTLANSASKDGVKFALESFLKVGDDFNINTKFDNVSGKFVDQKIQDMYTILESARISWDPQTYLKNNWYEKFVFEGKNGEKITLNTEGRTYEWMQNIVTNSQNIKVLMMQNSIKETFATPNEVSEYISGLQTQLQKIGLDNGIEIVGKINDMNIDIQNDITAWNISTNTQNKITEINAMIKNMSLLTSEMWSLQTYSVNNITK